MSDFETEILIREGEARARTAMSPRYIPHQPFLRQRMFLGLTCEEALYGGQAYGGKSDTLLMGALQYVDVPGYAALLLRRTFKDLSLPGALMERASEWLKPTPAHWSGETKTWTFPSAATLTFGYLDAENDKYQYQSSEFQYIGFDELTQFTDTQYTYLFSRIRRPRMPCVLCGGALEMRAADGIWQHDPSELTDAPEHMPEPDTIILRQYPASKERNLSIFQIPLMMRSGTNPGGAGADWVSNRFIPDGFTPKDAIEPKVWEKDAAIENLETRDIEYVHTYFVPSRKEDNPYADTTTYNKSLSKLGLVERKQLGEGDWTITATGRMYFDPEAVAKFEPMRGTVGELFMEEAPNGMLVPMFRPQRNGILELWVKPMRGHFYSIGADTAEGKDVNKGEGTAKGDWTVDQVRDVESGEQCARLRARISERAHAEQLNMLARWYNLAFVVPEIAGGYGRAMLDHLVLDLLYPIGHIFRRDGGRKQGSQTTPHLDELGFITGRTTKPSLVSGLNSAMLFHTIETYDAVTINEYKSFEQDKEGGASARTGCFDDCVISDALSVLGIAKFPSSLRTEAAKQKPQIVRYAVGGGVVPMGERDRALEEARQRRERQERM